MSEPEVDIEDELTVYARCMTGCRRQLVEAVRFIPVLILGIGIGLAGMIASFSQANWSPSLIGGCFAIFWFACSPLIACCWYLRWKSRPGVADTQLRVRDDGLEIIALREDVPSIFILWPQFSKCRKRVLAGFYLSLSITAHTDAGPLHCFAAEYTLCGTYHDAFRFIQDLEERVGRGDSVLADR